MLQSNLEITDKSANINSQHLSRTHNRPKLDKTILSLGVTLLLAGSLNLSANDRPLPTGVAPSSVIPSGGRVVGGQGDIRHLGRITNISQYSDLMAIDWDTFNLSADAQVNFFQPGSNSIALNRILDVNPSEIHGQINSNGIVVLLNPYGMLFGENSSLNVGGLIASSFTINPDDFMNGDFTLSALDGVDASVLNFGVINAATGGSVNLIGGRVENHGLIAANLGSVNLASGREAVVTFDNEGLIGVKVTQSALQDDIGVEPAVLNTGEITAAGGNILLTASASRDIFSQAVNIGDINEAEGVIVHEDGSFTLGASGISDQGIVALTSVTSQEPGGDIVNTGTLDVSVDDGDAGRIKIFGENITSSGDILANSDAGNGGEILMESNDTTLLIEDSMTSASSLDGGKGGRINILGNWVGLFDESNIDIFGPLGGGEVLVGGGFQGNDSGVRNAQRTYIGEGTRINADALFNGDGGKVIIWADESTQFYGEISAEGGESSGDGGFVEVSGKEGLVFNGDVSTFSQNGLMGTLLLDPKNITISTGTSTSGNFNNYDEFSDLSGVDTILNNGDLASELASTSVVLRANNDISVEADITSAQAGGSQLDGALTLEAGRSIFIDDNVSIALFGGNFTAIINSGSADEDNRDSGDAVFSMGAGSSITTDDGLISITTGNFDADNDGNFSVGDITLQSLDTTSTTGNGSFSHAGNIEVINNTGDIFINGQLLAEGNDIEDRGSNGGEITIEATIGSVTVSEIISTSGGDREIGTNFWGGDAGVINITAGQNIIINSAISANGGIADTSSQNGGSARPITFNAGGSITIAANVESLGGANEGAGDDGGDREIVLNGDGTDNVFNVNDGISLLGASATINGLGGTDTVSAGGTLDNTWVINGANSGTLENNNLGSDLTILFNGISSLIGNSGDDTFTFSTNPLNSGISVDGLTATTQDIVQLASGLSGATLSVANTSNIESFVNLGNANNILQGALVSNDWQITGTNSGTVNGVTFTDFSNIQGGTDGVSATSDDVFTLVGSGSMVSMDGNGGSNEIVGRETASNTWTITAANTGTVNGSGFQDIQTLTGGNTVDDTFGFSTDPSLSGITVDGRGAASQDTVELLAGLGGVTLVAGSFAGVEEFLNSGNTNNILQGALVSNDWQITGTNSGTVNGVTFTDFSNIQGGTDGVSATSDDVFTLVGSGSVVSMDGNGGSNEIIGRETASNTWAISAANTGTVNGSGFQDIQTLTGGDTVDDTFGFSTDPSLSGITVNGRGAASQDTVELLAGLGGVTLVAGSFAGVEEFLNSGNTNNILQGALVSNDWQITGTNSGTVNGITFTDFSNIQGGTDGVSATSDDVFTLVGSGSVVSMDGNGGSNEIIGRETASNTWTITAANTGTVNGSGFQDIQTLTGGNTVDDTFGFSTDPSLSGITVDGRGAASQDTVELLAGLGGVTLVAGSFAGVEEFLNSGNTNNILQGALVSNDWQITGTNSGTVNGVTFTDFSNIQGGTDGVSATSDDVFTLVGSGSVVSMDGNGGSNEIIGRETASNTWTITAANTGTVNGIAFQDIQTLTGGSSVTDTLTGINQNNRWLIDGTGEGIVEQDIGSPTDTMNFSGMENLVGGSLNDVFNLAEGGSITGLIDGATGTNTLQRSNTTGTNDWILTTANAGTLNGGSFSNIQILTGSANATDTLTGRDQDNTWLINGADSGSVEDAGATDTITFSEMENINGGVGTGDDRFVFTDTGSISGVVDGGAHTAGDIVDYSQQTTVNVNLANAFGGVINAETIQGNNSDSTLTGTNADNTWLITGENDGSIAGITFIDFNNLVGGNLADIFNLAEGGSITGLINGGAGTNTLQRSNTTGTNDWILTTANAGTLNGGSFSNIQILTGSANATDTLTGRDQDNTWLINGANSGSVEDAGATDSITFSEMENLNGGVGTGDDRFIFTAAGSISGTIDAGNHTNGDIIDYSNLAIVSLDVATALDQVVNAEIVQGNNTDSTLTGNNANNSWLITGENDGSIAGVTFIDFNNLVGGNLADIFNLAEGGSITGLINGGAGTNTLQRTNTTGTNDWILTTANAGTLNGGSFSNIQILTGSANATDTLTGRDQDNTWLINGADSGSVEDAGATDTITFSEMENLNGGVGTGDDTFSFTTSGIVSGTIDAGDHTIGDVVDYSLRTTVNVTLADAANGVVNAEIIQGNNTDSTLIGNNADNTWLITGENDGSVAGVTFIDFNNLIGGNLADIFNLAEGGSITGLINGGAGTNTLQRTNTTGTNDWILTTANAGTLNGGSFSNIQILTGSANATDTLTGRDQDNTWLINGADSGSVEDAGATDTITFSEMENLNGGVGTGDDRFVFTAAGSISGTIDAGNHTNGDIIDYSNLATVSLDVATALNQVVNAEIVQGNNTDSTLTGANADNTWLITGENDGTVAGLTFVDFNNLVGGSLADIFNLAEGGSITGLINGGAGTNTLQRTNTTGTNDWILTTANAGTLNGGSFSNVQILVGSANATDTLTGRDQDNTWLINGADSGSVEDAGSTDTISFSEMENLNGGVGTGDDRFVFIAAGSISGTIDAGNHTNGDIIDYSNLATVNLSLANALDAVANAEIVQGNNTDSTLTGNNASNTWLITGENDGSVAGVTFIDFNNLVGGNLADIFNLAEGGSITGLINGGAGTNTLQRTNTTGTNDWILTTANAGTLNGGSFSNVQILTGSANATDTLTGRDQDNTWLINGANSGSVEDAGATDTITFSEMENLNGGVGTGDDRFAFTAAGSISGIIDAGNHTNGDIIDYSNLATVDLSLANALDAVVNAEIVQGNNTDSTLTGNNASNTWLITGENDGSVAGVTFIDFNNLVGGDLADIFNLAEGGSITGLINGGAGTNTLQRTNTTGTNDWILTTANAGTLNGGSFSNIQILTGSANATDTLTGRDQDNTWLISGADSGSVEDAGATDTISFSEMENLNGGVGTGDDRFAFTAAGSISGTIDAGNHTNGDIIDYSNLASVSLNVSTALDQVDNAEIVQGNNTDSTLTGEDANTTWLISGENDGSVAGVTFVDFNNLVGGNLADIFNLVEGGSITGLINGGAGTNTLQRSNTTGTNDWVLTTANAGTLNGGGFSNVQILVGSANATDTLTGRDQDNNWLIDGANSGSVENVGATDTITFSEMENLNGGVGVGDDRFTFEEGSSISGVIDAGDHTVGDVVDYSLQSTVNVTLATAFNGVTNAEIIQGNDTDSTITGDNIINNWLITSINSGSLGSLTFIGFNNIIGGNVEDTFTLGNGAEITGSIDGGLGANEIIRNNTIGTNQWTMSGEHQGSLNGNDFFNIQSIVGSATVEDTLTGNNQNNDWLLDGIGSGNVSAAGASLSESTLFSNMDNLVGGDADDRFIITDSGSVSGVIDAGDHNLGDIVDYSLQTTVSVDLSVGINGILNAEVVQGNNSASTLYATNSNNIWYIDGENDGTLNSLTFIDFNYLVGGNLDDAFELTQGGLVTGQISGGAGSNTLQRSNTSGVNDWVLTAAHQGTLNGVVFTNFQTLIGSATAIDTLSGLNQNNDWFIDGTNSGNVSESISGATDTLVFSNIENLNGGTSDDRFIITDTGSISGLIDAGAHVNGDIVDYSLQTVVNVSLANAFSGVSNAEIIQGNNTDSTLTGENTASTWLITGENDGLIGSLSFIDFNNLIGGSGDDLFEIQQGGSITGLINGAGGFNTLQRTNTTGANIWELTAQFQGNLNGGAFSNIQSLVGSSQTTDTLIGIDQDNDWLITGTDAGSVSFSTANPTDTLLFTGMENLTGGNGDDRFIMTSTGTISGLIDGGDHVLGDVIDYSSLITVDLSLAEAFAGVSNVEIVQGNNTDSTLTGNNVANSWVITDENDGTVDGVTFIDFNNIIGGSGVDTFTIEAGGAITGVINGGIGAGIVDLLDISALLTDTTVALDSTTLADFNVLEIENIQANTDSSIVNSLLASDTVNTWNIDGINSGTLNTTAVSVEFAGFANLIGGELSDLFNLNSADHVTGLIDGGTGGGDELSLLSLGRDITVQLGVTAGASSFDVLYANNIEVINANPTQSNTLIGSNVASRWVIDGPNTSSIENSLTSETVSFSGFSTLTGGTNDDSFEIIDATSIAQINGGDGAGNDAIDYSNTTADVNIVIGGALTPDGVEITGIEGLIGNSSGSGSAFNSTITVNDGNNTWTVGDFDGAGIADGVNDGLFQDADGNVISFIDFNILQGGDGIDIFNIQNASSITGYIDGGAGNDELRLAINGMGEVRFIGGLGEDSVLISGGGSDYDAIYTSDVNGDEQLAYNSQSSGLYTLSFDDVETIQDDVIANNFTINGSDATDTISLSTGVVIVNGGPAVNYSNRTNLILNGGVSDVFDLAGDLNFSGGTITLNNSSMTNSTNSLATADSLILNASANVGSESDRLRTNIDRLSLDNVVGDIYLDEANSIQLQNVSTSGRFDLHANGDITQSNESVLISDELFVLNSTGDIILTNQNQLQGSVDLSATSSVTFSNANNTDFAGINTENLNLDIQGDVSDSGDIIVTGLADLNANGNNVVFDNASNNFNRVTAANINNLTLVDTGALVLNQISLGGAFDVTANDLQTSAVISAGSLVFNATGLVDVGADIESLTGSISISGASVNQSANLSSQTDINVNSSGQVMMAATSESTAIGNISYTAENNLNISLLNTQAGTIALSSVSGQIVDNNGELDNVIANRAELNAQSGIGALDALETQIDTLYAQNGVGQIGINNRGTITLERLATIGDIEFNNTDLDGSDIYFMPGSVDAGYDDGALLMTTEGGSFLGVGGVPSFENADIVARAATFIDASFTGTFGSITRPLVLRIRDVATITVRTSFSPLFAPPLPEINDSNSLFSFSSFDTISALAGGQLVEVESLVDVDPAIFTDLRNYNNDEVAVRLPNDQLFDYEEESEDESESERPISVGTR